MSKSALYTVLESLDTAGIRYCHWKSNEHLDAGLCGETDIDMLVAHDQASQCREVLTSHGWLYDAAPPFTEMEHWMGFDTASGRLLHIHLHTAGLPVGPSKRKIYTLPQSVSDWVLTQRVRTDGVWTASPETELFMLILRFALKSGPRNLAGAYVRTRDVVPPNLRKEFQWLVAQDIDTLSCPVLSAGFSACVQSLRVIMNDTSAPFYRYIPLLLRMRLLVLRYITPYRICARRKKGGKTLQRPTPVFAFVGVDGSGKTTLVSELRAWFGWKFNAQMFYLGTPKKCGFGGVLYKVTRKVPGSRWVFRLYAALYRLATALRARRAAHNGCIVLTDRYPTPLLWQVSDGPRATGFLSSIERTLYRAIPAPGRLVVLRVPEEILRLRDSTVPTETRIRKLNGIDALLAANTEIPLQVVDASRSREAVLLECKQMLFETLRGI